jgi:hypothetical protein
MKRVPVLRSVLAALAIAAVIMQAAGCSKKLTVDPTFTTPEGVPSPDARLIVYQDIGSFVQATHEFPPNSAHYVLDSTFTVYNFGPGTVQGMVFDGTAASGYQMLRREAGGGYAPLKDFITTPAVKFLQSHWEAYTFHDQPDAGSQPPTYEGRGALDGSITTSSPLTNVATLNGSSIADVPVVQPRFDTFPGDRLPAMRWPPIPGAAAYVIQTFQYRGDIRVGSEKFVYGIPAPIAIGKVHDYFIGILPPTPTHYKLGDPGAIIVQNLPMIGPDRFFFRITAIDSSGRLIGCTAGTVPDTVRIGGEAFLYSPGAEVICVECHKLTQ